MWIWIAVWLVMVGMLVLLIVQAQAGRRGNLVLEGTLMVAVPALGMALLLMAPDTFWFLMVMHRLRGAWKRAELEMHCWSALHCLEHYRKRSEQDLPFDASGWYLQKTEQTERTLQMALQGKRKTKDAKQDFQLAWEAAAAFYTQHMWAANKRITLPAIPCRESSRAHP